MGNIPANTVSTLVYETIVDSAAPGSELINQATITTNDPKANSNTAKATVTLLNDSINIDKKADTTSANIGDIVTYTVTLNSSAERNLNNLIIKDTLPKGFIYQPGTAKLNQQAIAASNISSTGNTLIHQSRFVSCSYKSDINLSG